MTRKSGSGRMWMRIAGLAFIALSAAASIRAEETALDRYIAKQDSVYRWEVARTIEGEGYKADALRLVSQTWRSAEEVDQPVWWDWLTIICPDKIEHDTAMLYIGGGDNKGNDPPSGVSDRSAKMAVETRSVVADLGMVPNQPLTFSDHPDKGRYEDDLIAYSRTRYIPTGDEEWLVRLAMVKSAVRAMDAMQEFLEGRLPEGRKIEHFVVAGGSKRGWTTWLTGIVDPRVSAMIPIVIDALNTEAITRHHYEAYGFFSTALGDYIRHGLYPDWLDTPEIDHIYAIEDPWRYRDRERMKIPKLVLNASGDQYFLPDNSQFYFADLPEEKYLRYVPNAKHNLAGGDAHESITAFYDSVLNERDRPDFSWTMNADESIEVVVKDPPLEVNLWQARNPEARDFRLDTIGKAWTKTRLENAGENPNRFVAIVDKPEKGFAAFYVELVYDSGGKYPHKFTTDVSVIPDIKPYDFGEARERKKRGENLLKPADAQLGGDPAGSGGGEKSD